MLQDLSIFLYSNEQYPITFMRHILFLVAGLSHSQEQQSESILGNDHLWIAVAASGLYTVARYTE